MPDYYRSVDVAKQSLAEITNRPKFGGAVLSAGSLQVWDGVLTSLVQINGRGMVYGGSIWLDAPETQSDSEVWLGIDGVNIEGLSFERLKLYSITDPRKAVISLNLWDGINWIYSVGISYGLTFESRLDLKYFERYGRRVTVHYRLIYALI